MAGDPTEEWLQAMAQAEAAGTPMPMYGAGNPAALRDFNAPQPGAGLTVFPGGWRPGMAPISQGGVPAPTAPALSSPGAGALTFPSGKRASTSGPYSPGALQGAIGSIGKEANALNTSQDDEESFRSAVRGIRGQQERNMGQVGEAYSGAIQKQQKDMLTVDTMNAAMQSAATESRQKLGDLTMMAKYANSGRSANELRQLEGIRDTGKFTTDMGERDATPEERKKAAAELQQGGEIDPKRALKGFRHITSIIGAFLGTLGSSMTGGPNTAVEMIQARIEQDIAAQKANFDLKKGAVSNEMNMYALARQQGMDEREAILASNAMAWKSVDQIAQQMGVKNDALGSAAKSFQAEADLIRENRSKKFDLLFKQGQLSSEQTRNSIAFNESQGRMAAAQGKAAQAGAGARAALKNLDTLIGLRDKYGTEHGGGEIQSEMETRANDLVLVLPRIIQHNRGTDTDQKIVKEMIGDPTGIGWTAAKLRTVRRLVLDEIEAEGGQGPEAAMPQIGNENR